jgi:hypothetical protein
MNLRCCSENKKIFFNAKRRKELIFFAESFMLEFGSLRGVKVVWS